METVKRKRRSDRLHVIYQLTCNPTGETYIGITVARGRAFKKSMDIRWTGHCYHATVENRPTTLADRIRTHGANAFGKEILAVVRGKTEAHAKEMNYIRNLRPSLNILGKCK
jgi:hypothetical protein